MLHLYKSLVVIATACIIIKSLYDQKKKNAISQPKAVADRTPSSGKGVSVTTGQGMVIWTN